MNNGGALRVPFRASRPRRAAVLLVTLTAMLSACGASGGGQISGADSGAGADAPTGGEHVDCTDLDPATWTVAPTKTDLAATISDGTAPGLHDGAPPGPANLSTLFTTPDDFLAQSNVPDPAARRKVMDQAGSHGGIKSEWTQGNGFIMQTLAFADARAAATYVQARLASICGQGGTQNGVTMLDAGDGITWTDPLGATHGEFIFGDSQVSLTTCGSCDPVSLDQMQAWHDAFVDAYATGPAAPIA